MRKENRLGGPVGEWQCANVVDAWHGMSPGCACVCMGQTKQGTSASEGHRAASINGGGGGQNVDVVGLTCRSDGWAEGK